MTFQVSEADRMANKCFWLVQTFWRIIMFCHDHVHEKNFHVGANAIHNDDIFYRNIQCCRILSEEISKSSILKHAAILNVNVQSFFFLLNACFLLLQIRNNSFTCVNHLYQIILHLPEQMHSNAPIHLVVCI